MDTQKYGIGFLAGSTGVLFSHPFDTVKTVYQTTKYTDLISCIKNLFHNGGLKRFYKGITPPLIGVSLEKSLVFGTYNSVIKYTNNNHFLSGIISGLVCTSVVTPIEKLKIIQQNNNSIKSVKLNTLYNGWTATLFREVPGFGIYFNMYNFLNKNEYLDNKYLFTSFINGSISGATAWLFIYPSDPIKTIMQNNNINLKKAVNHIYSNYGVNGFYRGFGLGLFRAIPLHGGVFFGYEMFNRLFN